MAAAKRQRQAAPRAVDADEVLRGLYEEHAGALRRFAYSISHGRADPDDVVQSAFLILYQATKSGKEIKDVRGFLYRSARSAVFRYERSRRDVAPEWVHEAMPSPEVPSPEDDVLAKLQADRLLASLPKRSAELLLCWAVGWTSRDIAEHLSISESSVKAALTRARLRLRRDMLHQLDQLDPHPPARQAAPAPPPLDAYEWILGLDRVVERLRQTYTEKAARDWLVRSHPLLDNQRPIDLLRAGETRKVQGVIDAVAEGVFV